MTADEVISKLEINGVLVPKRCTEKYLKKYGLLELMLQNTPGDFKTISDKIYFLKYGGGYCLTCGIRTNKDVIGNGFARYCKDHFHDPKKNKPAHNFKDISIEQIKELYIEKQLSILDIAKTLGTVSNTTVKKRLIEGGVELRSHSHTQSLKAKRGIFKPRISIDRTQLIEQYLAGTPTNILADTYNCHIETIRRFLIQEGQERCRKRSTIEWVITNILKKHSIPHTVNNRSIISPLELDVVLSNTNIAIEINGLYTHSFSAGNKSKTYHNNKYRLCKEKGIRLLQFWEDDITNNPIIIESMILNAVGLTPNKVNARDTLLKGVEQTEINRFCQDNHIQGPPGRNKGIGLFKDGLLQALLCYRHNKGKTVLTRYCSKAFTNVRGGFSKLISTLPTPLITYSSNDISDGNLYYCTGFKKVGENPDMWYTDYKQLLNREKFMKKKLSKVLDMFDPNKTEIENMLDNGYDVIYKSGTVTWLKV
jgi:hypothetical protein